jgi:hypothetical protein
VEGEEGRRPQSLLARRGLSNEKDIRIEGEGMGKEREEEEGNGG